MSDGSNSSSLAPVLVEYIETPEPEEQTEEQEDEQAEEEPAKPLPVVDENGVVHLTRTTAKGG